MSPHEGVVRRKRDALQSSTQAPKARPWTAWGASPRTAIDLWTRSPERAAGAAWETPHTHVLSIVAPGGVGKTALVNRWLGEMATQDYAGARRVYGWSFYSQGAGESKNASADAFLADALEWFGDPEAKALPDAWKRGQRLAELVRRDRVLRTAF